MTTLSTHDTKRSEDVRARLFLLSEIPVAWVEAVSRWRSMNGRHWPAEIEPDPAIEYLLYQTAVGAWPIDAKRLRAYMEKASREAKLRTSWTDPDPDYDRALADFAERVLGDEFADDVDRFAAPLVAPGRVVSLAQKLLQLTMPGVPDIYQGTELWDLSLVDPDNRRPVDFAARRAALERLVEHEADAGTDPKTILGEMDTGLPKMWVVRQALALRCERPDDFVEGGYRPLVVRGDAAVHAVGFLRGEGVAVVVPRLVIGLARRGGWAETVVDLPAGRWTNRLTGERLDSGDGGVPLVELLGRFPVALVVREEG